VTLDSARTYCEQCRSTAGPFTKFWKPTTLGRALPFVVCVDTASCQKRAQARHDARESRPKARASDLYSD